MHKNLMVLIPLGIALFPLGDFLYSSHYYVLGVLFGITELVIAFMLAKRFRELSDLQARMQFNEDRDHTSQDYDSVQAFNNTVMKMGMKRALCVIVGFPLLFIGGGVSVMSLFEIL